jgi:hypothetical protein
MFGLNASREPHGIAEFMIHDADTSSLSVPSTLEYALFHDHPSDAQRVATAMQCWAAMQRELLPDLREAGVYGLPLLAATHRSADGFEGQVCAA